MLKVACVLRSGGIYKPEHVRELCNQISAHAQVPFEFVCLTDMHSDDFMASEIVHLDYHWPGWWSKIELFRPDLWELNDVIVYLDLDTVVVGCVSKLINRPFTMLKDFYRPSMCASGVMAWQGANTPTEVFEAFSQQPSRFIREYKRWPDRWGDQGFTSQHCKTAPYKFGDEVCSYKVHVKETGEIPEGAVAIAFHGRPRPWEVDLSCALKQV